MAVKWQRKDSHHQREKGKSCLNILKAYKWYVNDVSICSCRQNLRTSNLIKRLKFVGPALAHTIPSQPWRGVSALLCSHAVRLPECFEKGESLWQPLLLVKDINWGHFSHYAVAKMYQYQHQHSHKDQKKSLVLLLIAFGDFSCQGGWKVAKSRNKVAKLATLV